MDYNLVLSIAAHAGFFISLFSVVLFHRTYRFVAPTVGARTRHSLVLFAVAALWYTVSPLISLYFFDIGRLVFAFGVALLANSVSEIYFESDRAVVAGRVFTVVYVIMSVAVFLYAYHLFVIMGMTMSLIVIAVMYVAAKIHMVSPSPYSVSVFAISGLTIGLAYLLHTGFIFNNPQYFAILVLPTSLISAFLVSVNRPWRLIVNLTVVYFALGTSVPLVAASLLSGEFGIYSLVMAGAMAVIATVIPLNYFLIEAGETRARTPYFLAVTLFSLAFLISTHYVNWAFAFGTTPYTNTDPLVLLFTVIRGQWDYMIVYTDWLLGLIAVTSFMLAGLATFMPKSIRHARRIVLAITTTLIVLGSEFASAGRWTVEALVPFVLAELAVGVYAYVRTARRLRKLGAKRAASHFVAFMSSIVLGALVVLVSFEIPPVLTMGLFVMIALALMRSSPRRSKLLGEPTS
ncbi:MAG: hypothetical protein ACTSYX_05975 [Candidatus Thorarchaeota archaeon]